jgi:hypothetical protein
MMVTFCDIMLFCDISGITSWSINAHHMQLAKKEQAFFVSRWMAAINPGCN